MSISLLRCLRRFRRRTWCLLLIIYWICTFLIVYVIERNSSSKEYQLNEQLFRQWRRDKLEICESKFAGYVNQFALLHQILVDRNNFVTYRMGGEDISAVLHQPEHLEYFHCKPGAFQLKCPNNKLSYYFGLDNHLNDWVNNTIAVDEFRSPYATDKTFTIAIQRYEYADLYRTMTDWYNSFVVMTFFNQSSSYTNILLLDGHPEGKLDTTWSVLFNSMYRLTSLPPRTVFTKMAWGMLGYNSPLTQPTFHLPLLEEFRRFFLDAHHVSYAQYLNCKRLKIVFAWRRNLILHPRNPSGAVTGKIYNEQALLTYFKDLYPNHEISGIQLEALNISQQLRITSRTDVLLGMSGGAMTHVLFLPDHAGVIQFYYRRPSIDQLRNLARARKLKYEYWSQDSPSSIDDEGIVIPPKKIYPQLKRIIRQMC